MSTEQDVRTVLMNEIGMRESSDLASDFPLIEKGLLDSMRIFQLVTAIEDRFGIQVADEDIVAENFETLEAITRLVSTKVGR